MKSSTIQNFTKKLFLLHLIFQLHKGHNNKKLELLLPVSITSLCPNPQTNEIFVKAGTDIYQLDPVRKTVVNGVQTPKSSKTPTTPIKDLYEYYPNTSYFLCASTGPVALKLYDYANNSVVTTYNIQGATGVLRVLSITNTEIILAGLSPSTLRRYLGTADSS